MGTFVNSVRVSGKAKLKENYKIGIGIGDMQPKFNFSRPVNESDLFVFRLCKKVMHQASAAVDADTAVASAAANSDHASPVADHRPSRCVRCE